MPKGRTDDIPLGFTLNERGMKTGADKRRHARLKQSPKDLAILVDDGSGKVQRFNATLIDSTPEGVGIECAVPLEVGLRATVVGHQSAPDSPGVRQSARVAWSTAVRPGVFVIGLHLDSRRRESSQSPNGNEPETPLDYYDLLEVSDKATPDTIRRVSAIAPGSRGLQRSGRAFLSSGFISTADGESLPSRQTAMSRRRPLTITTSSR